MLGTEPGLLQDQQVSLTAELSLQPLCMFFLKRMYLRLGWGVISGHFTESTRITSDIQMRSTANVLRQVVQRLAQSRHYGSAAHSDTVSMISFLDSWSSCPWLPCPLPHNHHRGLSTPWSSPIKASFILIFLCPFLIFKNKKRTCRECRLPTVSACPPWSICSSINFKANATKSLFKFASNSKAFWDPNDQSRGGFLEPENGTIQNQIGSTDTGLAERGFTSLD